ncbi:hypothetical protein L6R53_22860 [Myxococcota bacterium]|nr:hypothetical protein [Myxococcota bacterium]
MPLLLPLLWAAPWLFSPPAAAGPPAEGGWYLGHTWVGNRRDLPVLGSIETRTDTWVLARLRPVDGGVEITQQPCAFRIRPTAGVKVRMDEQAVRRLPEARFLLEDEGPGDTAAPEGGASHTAASDMRLVAPPWETGWGEEDVDADGLPGATIRVYAALCGGHLQVASNTRSEATATWQGDALTGTLGVEVTQTILDASGACLRVVARDSVERMQGHFRYEPAPPGATCDAVPLASWPQAEEPARGR